KESQASSVLPLGTSLATSRWRRPAMSDFEGTCIRNNQSVELLAVASIPRRFKWTKGAAQTDEHADFDPCPDRYLEPRPRSFTGRLRGFLPRRDVQGRVPRDRSRADRRSRARVARG